MASKSDGVPVFHLSKEMREYFTKTRDLLNSILETFDILEDKETMTRIIIAENEKHNSVTFEKMFMIKQK